MLHNLSSGNSAPVTIVSNIDRSGRVFNNFLHQVLFQQLADFDSKMSLKEIQDILHLIYHESILQIFDFMTYDFSDFVLRMVSYPNYDRFYYNNILFNEPAQRFAFTEAFKNMATGLYLEIREQYPMIFQPGYVFVLEHSGLDHIVFKLFRDETS